MIFIDDSLRSVLNNARLGVLSCTADVCDSSKNLLDDFHALVQKLQDEYTELPQIAKNPHIASTRQAYKILGKDPLKYRNSAESMLRRICKKNGLYFINNAVDINNMISIESGYSLGSYDMTAIKGHIVWKKTPDGEKYKGIGKDTLNIEHLPALYDDDGVFGNPTSDSQRTMITCGNRKPLLFVIYCFDEGAGLEYWLNKTELLLKTHANADSFQTQIIQK